MTALASFGKTAAVLVALWAILALVGIAAGVLPPHEGVGADLGARWFGDPSDGDDASVDLDGGVPDAGGADASAPVEDAGPVDAGAVVAIDPPPAAMGPTLARHRVCPEPSTAPSMAVVDVVGDARRELVVGCGNRWEVLGVVEGGLMRIASVAAESPPADRAGMTGRAEAIDVDGDGASDLVLPYALVGPGGATSGGGLFVLPRQRSGAPGDARSLAPIAAVEVASIALARGPGLVALDQANPFARLPSEAWVFALGAAPARIATPHGGPGATGLGVVDLDRDGTLDVVVASSESSRVDVFYGDAEATFRRTRTLSVPSAASIAVGDLDGDGAPDVAVVGAGLARILSRSGDPIVEPIAAAPPELRDVAIIDVDADRRAELVGWSHPRLTVLAARSDGSYEARTLVELAPGEIGPRRHLVVDLDGDGEREVVLLVVGTDGPTRSLDLVIVPSTERGAIQTEAARPIPDAPLSLLIALPDPNAP